MSTPTTLNWLVRGRSGTATVQLVTLVQVRGHSTPLSQTVLTFTGAVPLTEATSLLIITDGLTVKLGAFSAAICEEMLLWAWESQGLMLELGSSTVRPLATKSFYLASSRGPLLFTLSGPLTSSCNARQYIRRNVGLL